jgi:hypothetical protein
MLTDEDDDDVVINSEKILVIGRYADNPEYSVISVEDDDSVVVKQTVAEVYQLL